MTRWLGLDCGGTKTRWSWWPDGARPAGAGAGVQPASNGVDAAAQSLLAVLRAAAPAGDVAAAVCAIAGAGDPAIRSALLAALRTGGIDFPLAIVGDTLAAAAAVLGDGPGLLVFAGTGSFAVARAHDGGLHRAGGRGHLLGDQGSGYDLVRRAAAAVVLAVDGLSPPTALTEVLGREFAAPTPSRLGAVLQRLSTGEVAARLPAVLDCAQRGDAVATGVLEEGMEALALIANAALRTGGLDWRDLAGPVHLGGGVLVGSEALRQLLGDRLRAFGATAFATVPADAAARGAARLAHDWDRGVEPQHGWVEHGAL